MRGGDAVVAGDVKALASQRSGAVDDVLARPVVIIDLVLPDGLAVIVQRQQVKIGGGENLDRMAQVAHDRNGLEEDLRPDDRRAKVAENSALELADSIGKHLEIL